jgi:hypothetical protein
MKREPVKTDRAGFFLFAALIPHRNAVFVVEKIRQQLFALGLDGAFSFPAAAPLALLSRPLSGVELKAAAAELRKLLGKRKITLSAALGTPPAGTTLPGTTPPGETLPEQPAFCSASPPPAGPAVAGLSFFGPCLDMPLPTFPESAVLARWEKPFLAPAILGSGAEHVRAEFVRGMADKLRAAAPPPELSFRAAALANLAVYPAGNGEADYSYAWEMGRLYWLPNPD